MNNIKILKNIKTSVPSNKNINFIKNKILFLIDKIILENKLIIKDYNTGIWLKSLFLYEKIFKNSINNFNKDEIIFFNPIVFAESILNSITHFIAKKTNIKGFSNSLTYSNHEYILSEFLNSMLKYGIIINVEKYNKKILINITLVNNTLFI